MSSRSLTSPHARLAVDCLEDRLAPAVELVSGTPLGVTGIDETDQTQPNSQLLTLQVARDSSDQVSRDGRYVVFQSSASNLTAQEDANGGPDVFVRDRLLNTTMLVSVTVSDKAGGGQEPVITADGRYVAFLGLAGEGADALVPGVQFAGLPGFRGAQVYVRDLQTNTTRLATYRPDGLGSTGNSAHVTIADDGQAVAFTHDATPDDLLPAGADSNGREDVFLHYFNGKQTVQVSRNVGGTDGGNGRSYAPVISGDGARVAFLSDATNLTALTDDNESGDLFSYQHVGEVLSLVSAATDGGFAKDAKIQSYRVDDKGLRFVFPSGSGELVAGVPAEITPELYLRDLPTATTTLVTRLPDGTPSGGRGSLYFDLSADGFYVSFVSGFDARFTGHGPGGFTSQVYLYDTNSQFLSLVSRSVAGGVGNEHSYFNQISRDGRYVMFFSSATDLVPGTNAAGGLYVRDTVNGKTFAVSTDAAGKVVPIGSLFTDMFGLSDDGFTAVFVNGAAAAYGFTDPNGGASDVFGSVIPNEKALPASVTINQAADQADPADAPASVRFTVEFSRPVLGFAPDDIVFAGSTVGGNLAATVAGRDAYYTVTVTGFTTSGVVVASVRAGAGFDPTGRPSADPLVGPSTASTSTDNSLTITGLPPPPPPPPPPPAVAQAAAVGGLLNGSALALTPSDGKYSPGATLTFFAGSTANVRTATADVNGDGTPDFIGGTGPGRSTQVVVLDGKTNATIASFAPFEASFVGGVLVTAVDLDGDGKAEVVVSPDQGGGPLAAIYSGAKLTAGLTGDAAQIIRYFAIDDKTFFGGARPALGDLTGDGRPELTVSAGFLGGPRITVWDGASILSGSPRQMLNFFAFENTLRNGAFVSAGDVTGDGRADLIFGGGPGGAPRVRIFDGTALLAAAGTFSTLDEVGSAQRANFFAGDNSLRGGVRLAMRDVNADGKADLVTGSGEGEASRVRVFLAANLLANAAPVADQQLDPFGITLANGVFVG